MTPMMVPLQALFGDLLYASILFVVLAIVAAIAGASEIAGLSKTLAKWLAVAFLLLAVISLVL